MARVETAGAGYVNFFFDRRGVFRRGGHAAPDAAAGAASAATRRRAVVEHTNINPNKAAHIGHLRNAALGDTFVRLLRRAGRRVEVQNYIDNTGVQVADVVVGFQHIEKKSLEEVRALAAAPQFDYLCWDLYARVTQFYEEDKSRLALRGETLAAIEDGHGAAAELAEIISVAIARCHLRTMERLGVEYDVLPRESEILHLKFWEAAFERLKQRGAIHLAETGQECGLLGDESRRQRKAATGRHGSEAGRRCQGYRALEWHGHLCGQRHRLPALEIRLAGPRFRLPPLLHVSRTGTPSWTSAADEGEPGAPAFGHATEVFNVIDTRQAYLQNVVVAGLRALGFEDAGRRARSIFRTRWWRFRRVAPRRWATRSRRRRRASLTWK